MMKLFKALFVILAAILVHDSYGQSPEETIAWMKVRLDNHFQELMDDDTKKEADSIKDCGFICSLSLMEKYAESRLLHIEYITACEMVIRVGKGTTLTIPFRELSLVNAKDKEAGTYYAQQKQKTIKKEFFSAQTWKVDYVDCSRILIDEKIAPGLSEKIEKAIKRLSSYCTN